MLRFLKLSLVVLFTSQAHTAEPLASLAVGSYNILSQEFDDPSSPRGKHALYDFRRPSILKTLEYANLDILGLQEVWPTQAVDIASTLKGYKTLCMVQAPSEVRQGTCKKGKWFKKLSGLPTEKVREKIGTSLLGIVWRKKNLKLIDKGFAPLTTRIPIRGLFWAVFSHLPTRKKVVFLTSHYPAAVNKKTKRFCALLEREAIARLLKRFPTAVWVSTGDRNTFTPPGAHLGETSILNPLLEIGFDAFHKKHHTGPITTFAGFGRTRHKSQLAAGKLQSAKRLDVIISSMQAKSSEHILTQTYGSEISFNPAFVEPSRRFASDHLLVKASYQL